MIHHHHGRWRRTCAAVLMTLLICTLGTPLLAMRAYAANGKRRMAAGKNFLSSA